MLPGFQLLASGIDLLISPGEQWTNHDRELKIQVKCNRQSTRWIEKEEIAIQNKLNLQSNHKDLNFSTATAIQKQKRKEEPQSRCFLNRWATKKKKTLTFHWILVVSWGPLQWLKPFGKNPLERLDRKWITTSTTTTTTRSSDVGILWFWNNLQIPAPPSGSLPIVYGWSIRDTPGGPERIFFGKKKRRSRNCSDWFWVSKQYLIKIFEKHVWQFLQKTGEVCHFF